MINSRASSERFLSLTMIATPRSAVDQSINTVLSKIAFGRTRRYVAPLKPSDIYEIDPPAGGAHLFKVALYSPRQRLEGCVLVTNVADGWNSLSHLIAKEHQQFQIQVVSTRSNVSYPQNRIDVWHGGRSTRTVMVMRDSDEWTFFQKGKPERFEDLTLYDRRLKKDRLNREIITSYLRKLGWEIDEPSFWKASEAIYFEEIRKK